MSHMFFTRLILRKNFKYYLRAALQTLTNHETADSILPANSDCPDRRKM